jgi:hypothetical protein
MSSYAGLSPVSLVAAFDFNSGQSDSFKIVRHFPLSLSSKVMFGRTRKIRGWNPILSQPLNPTSVDESLFGTITHQLEVMENGHRIDDQIHISDWTFRNISLVK